MKDFSPSYLDKLANRLEEMSGDPRLSGEDSDSRILSSLETMGNITTPNGDYQQRVCDAVNNINIGGGGTTNLGTANFNENGVYNATDFDLDGFNKVTVNVESVTQLEPMKAAQYEFSSKFANCFNSPVNISNNFTNCDYMFSFMDSFNSKVTIPNSVTSCALMFEYAFQFNQPVNIPDSVVNCYYMFNHCDINQPVTIGNSVTDCFSMFCDSPFNQPITIPNSVTNCGDMFRWCNEFNQPVTVPESVTNISRMFTGCSNMNSLVRLPEKFNNGTTTAFWDNCPVSVANGTLEFY